MPFWYGLGLVLLLAETVVFRREPELPLLLAAAGIWIVVIVLTLLFLVPINNRMIRLSADAPARDTLREHSRWDSMHRARVAALAAAMVLFLIAVRP